MAIFPSNIISGYSLIKIPIFRTNVINYGNKVEQRVSFSGAVRWKFELNFEILPYIEANIIMDFYIARKGAYDAFWWANTEEAYRGITAARNTAYALNQIISPSTPNGRSYQCTVAGTTGGSEPTWPTTEAATVVDGGATWKENSYWVRFEVDEINIEYFSYQLYNYNRIAFIEVS